MKEKIFIVMNSNWLTGGNTREIQKYLEDTNTTEMNWEEFKKKNPLFRQSGDASTLGLYTQILALADRKGLLKRVESYTECLIEMKQFRKEHSTIPATLINVGVSSGFPETEEQLSLLTKISGGKNKTDCNSQAEEPGTVGTAKEITEKNFSFTAVKLGLLERVVWIRTLGSPAPECCKGLLDESTLDLGAIKALENLKKGYEVEVYLIKDDRLTEPELLRKVKEYQESAVRNSELYEIVSNRKKSSKIKKWN